MSEGSWEGAGTVRGRLQGRFVVVGGNCVDRECGIPHASAAGLMGFGDLGSWASAGATALIRVWDRLFFVCSSFALCVGRQGQRTERVAVRCVIQQAYSR